LTDIDFQRKITFRKLMKT